MRNLTIVLLFATLSIAAIGQNKTSTTGKKTSAQKAATTAKKKPTATKPGNRSSTKQATTSVKKQSSGKTASSSQKSKTQTAKSTTAARNVKTSNGNTAASSRNTKQQPVRPQATAKKGKPSAAATPEPVKVADPVAEKEKLDAALALTSAAERAAALKKFVEEFPNSEHIGRARESLVVARAQNGDELLQASQPAEGVKMFDLAVTDAPVPMPERLYNEVISKFPLNLFYRGQRAAALKIASQIEQKAAGNAGQLLGMASFYIGVEMGAEARRIAESVIALDPSSVGAYQTLGFANRQDFDLDAAAAAFSKALELDPNSTISKRSLAEMKRALGLSDEAVTLYRSILETDESDVSARNGLVLSLFDAGKQTDAESEMAKALERSPANASLLSGAAYWYAANGDGAKAVELARKAIDAEPRLIWSHIALARGLMQQKKPTEAEHVLVLARRYGNFPTLEFEIASARLAAGFYRDAVEELQKSFELRDGALVTKLGGRVSREGKTFAELIANERKASIFEPRSADNADESAKLNVLFELSKKLGGEKPDEAELSTLVDDFVKGDDPMRLHRQIYAASMLLQKQIAVSKAADLAKAAVGGAESGLQAAEPGAAVMASELYESRAIAFSRNDILLVPDVPRQTLSAILRGRIEDITGWTLIEQKNYPEAIVHLRRAVNVLPDKSAWWRASLWRLGTALAADGKDKEALDSFVKSYNADKPDPLRYAVVENQYMKVNGNIDGLEAIVGANPVPIVAAADTSKPAAEQTLDAKPQKNEKASTAASETVGSVTDTAASAPEKTNNSEVKTPEPTQEVKTTETDTATQTAASTETVAKKPESKPEEAPKPPSSEPAAIIKKEEVTDPAKSETVKADTEKAAEDPVKPETVLPEKNEEKQTVSDTEAKSRAQVVEAPKNETKEPAVKADPPASTEKKAADENVPTTKNDATLPADVKTEVEQMAVDPPIAIDQKTTERQTSSAEDEKKPKLIVDDPLGGSSTTKPANPLFGSHVIEVPKPAAQKRAAAEPQKTGETGPAVTAAVRPRVASGSDVRLALECKMTLSSDNISIMNSGERLGILVTIEGEGDVNDISATSSSSKDVEVHVEPAIVGRPGTRYFLIRSISNSAGLYQAVFQSPCGRKEVRVNVR